MGYGAEIWGWGEREGMDRLEERYLRWVLRVDGRTPGYLEREELQRESLRGTVGRRAWEFEKKLSEGGGSGLARPCWEEIRGRFREGKVKSEWERERRKFFEDREEQIEQVERKREQGEARYEEWEKRDRQRERKIDKWKKIRESKYNRWYGVIKGEGVPGYLKKGGGKIGGEGWQDTGWGTR